MIIMKGAAVNNDSAIPAADDHGLNDCDLSLDSLDLQR